MLKDRLSPSPSYSVLGIKKELETNGILTPKGKNAWPKRTIETILANEKYVGDVLIYKTYCSEYPKTTRIRNRGEKDQYLISNHHPAIIEMAVFDSVQEEKKHRSNVELDENGVVIRKTTHYSAKR